MLISFLYAEPASEWLVRVRYAALGLTMALLQVAPLLAAAVLALGLLRRHRVLPSSLVLWSISAGMSFCLLRSFPMAPKA